MAKKRKKKQKISLSENIGIMIALINLIAAIITLIAAQR